MTEDKSQPSAERWRLMRSLYEQSGIPLKVIALVSDISVDAIAQRSCDELWCAEPRSPKARKNQNTFSHNVEADLRLANARTAKQVSSFLKRMLRLETNRMKSEEQQFDTQTSTKNILAIAKGVFTIEEMIAKLEKLTDASSLYPQDALEFHSRLEKQIANLANTRPEETVPRQSEPA